MLFQIKVINSASQGADMWINLALLVLGMTTGVLLCLTGFLILMYDGMTASIVVMPALILLLVPIEVVITRRK
jgi:hypothetical protein